MNKTELLEKYPWLNDSKEQMLDKYPWLNVGMTSWIDMMPEGWYASFGEFFFEDLDAALKESYPDGLPEDFRILDIKEKWGSLRVYLTHEPQPVSDVLYKYQYISSFVCLMCGAPYPFAHMTYDGWVMPLCERCYIGKGSVIQFDKYHNSYLRTVLRDSISVAEGPEDYITIECSDGKEKKERKIEIKETWKKIFQEYVRKTVI